MTQLEIRPQDYLDFYTDTSIEEPRLEDNNPELQISNTQHDLGKIAVSVFDDLELDTDTDEAIDDEAVEELDLSYEAQTTDPLDLYFGEVARYKLLTKEQELRLAIQKDRYMPYRPRPEEMEGLSPEEREDLQAQKMATLTTEEKATVLEGKRAFDLLVNSNLKLSAHLAKRYRFNNVPYLDLIQEGNKGIIRAVEKFDYKKGFRFTTYATWWVKQSLDRAIANQGPTIRTPVHVVERQKKVWRAHRELTAKLGHAPTNEQIADESKIPLQYVLDVINNPIFVTSLNAPTDDSGEMELGNLIATSPDDVEEQAYISVRDQKIREVIHLLPDNERKLIELRFGVGGNDGGCASKEAAQKLGLKLSVFEKQEAAVLAKLETLIKDIIEPDGQPMIDGNEAFNTAYSLALANGSTIQINGVQNEILRIQKSRPGTSLEDIVRQTGWTHHLVKSSARELRIITGIGSRDSYKPLIDSIVTLTKLTPES